MGGGDVLVQQAQGRGAWGTGEVELGKLAFGEGTASPLPLPRRGDSDTAELGPPPWEGLGEATISAAHPTIW